MSSIFKIFICGLAISFIGSLPPGTMTIAATFITAKQGIESGITYSVGSVLAEQIVIIILLCTIKWVGKWNSIYFLLQVFATLFLVAITIGCFYLALNSDKIAVVDITYSLQPFSSGFVMSILNPVHISFWLGWSAVLMKKNLLQTVGTNYSSYLIGIATGSILGFLVYVYGGIYILESLMKNQRLIILTAGIIMMIITLLHIKKLVLANSLVLLKRK